MKGKIIGLNTTLYQYGLDEEAKFVGDFRELSKTGQVTKVFINNGLAFEYTPARIVGNGTDPAPVYCRECEKEVTPEAWTSQPLSTCPDCGNVIATAPAKKNPYQGTILEESFKLSSQPKGGNHAAQ